MKTKPFHQALVQHGPQSRLLRFLVRTRLLGYGIGVALLAIYIAMVVLMILSPEPLAFQPGSNQQSIMVSNERE